MLSDILSAKLLQLLRSLARDSKDQIVAEACTAAGESLAAAAIRSERPVPAIPFLRNAAAAALIMGCRVTAASCFDFRMQFQSLRMAHTA
jgi:hypothetical protein